MTALTDVKAALRVTHDEDDALLTRLIGSRFAADFVAPMDELVRADKAIPLTPLQADLLTYDRPGDIYLRWDGAWVSRSSAAVEDERRVVL